MAVERTLVLVKPDGVRRRLVGEVIRRLEAKGLELVAMRMLQMDKEMASLSQEERKIVKRGTTAKRRRELLEQVKREEKR